MAVPLYTKEGKIAQAADVQERPLLHYYRINDVIYWIQHHSMAKMMVVHQDILPPYMGAIGSSSLEERAV